MNKLYLTLGGLVLALLGSWWLFSSDQNERVVDTIEPRPASAATITIIAFGDSLTAGYGLTASQAYPAQLEAALSTQGYEVRVINAGVSGETTRGNLERADFIRQQNPDIVLLGIGGNDALRLLPIAETKKNITETITRLQSGDSPPVIVLLEMQAPLTAGLGYKREFDGMYAELAATYGLLLAPFITADLFLNMSNKLSDGIHYNEVGYKQVVDLHVLPVVTQILEQFKE
jgi:acyl-CoA thioesterase I